MDRLKLWVIKILVCSWKKHLFIDKRQNLRTFFCTRCGSCNPRVLFPTKNNRIIPRSESGDLSQPPQ